MKTKDLPRIPPALGAHILLDDGPDVLDDLAIPPATGAVYALLLVPTGHLEGVDAAAPLGDLVGDVLAGHADVNAGGVAKEFRRVGPFVGLELPGLTRREDGD